VALRAQRRVLLQNLMGVACWHAAWGAHAAVRPREKALSRTRPAAERRRHPDWVDGAASVAAPGESRLDGRHYTSQAPRFLELGHQCGPCLRPALRGDRRCAPDTRRCRSSVFTLHASACGSARCWGCAVPGPASRLRVGVPESEREPRRDDARERAAHTRALSPEP